MATAVAVIEGAAPALKPCGYKILVRVRTASGQYAFGLWKTEREREIEQEAAMVGEVCEIGEDCYRDPKRFPNGPWCRVGDWVLFKAYSGTRIPLGGKDVHYRLLNDDGIEAVVRRPEEIE